MFVRDNTHIIMIRYCVPYLPWLHDTDTDRIISIYVMPPKVAKASMIVTVRVDVAGIIALKTSPM
jgi:hypothetical protein